MKRLRFKVIASLALTLTFSCDEPVTVVTNIVHPDGSVTRKIEMKNSKNSFEKSDLQVPFDSTWCITDSCEVSEKGDTSWIKIAVKDFRSADEINLTYKSDKGSNRKLSREAVFIKRFLWFNTKFRFSERIDKQLVNGYPVRDFLNEEELQWFYSPESLVNFKMKGADSLRYKAFCDTARKKLDFWTTSNMVAVWIDKFAKLTKNKEGSKIVEEALKSHEADIIKLIDLNSKIFDSLWTNGNILRKFVSEPDYQKFKTDADSALISAADELLLVDFKEYSVRIVMPGKLLGTNGFPDNEALQWPVKSDFFLTQTYEMWAESESVNLWAWFVSAFFLVFVITGVYLKKKKG